ncbi:hypothetical protein DFJ77DRAFT_449477 [Powellomyces hirtus]|nr:hypothetical protein DFJ77DRAFT_449477 [Powellomyces hirtus]
MYYLYPSHPAPFTGSQFRYPSPKRQSWYSSEVPDIDMRAALYDDLERRQSIAREVERQRMIEEEVQRRLIEKEVERRRLQQESWRRAEEERQIEQLLAERRAWERRQRFEEDERIERLAAQREWQRRKQLEEEERIERLAAQREWERRKLIEEEERIERLAAQRELKRRQQIEEYERAQALTAKRERALRQQAEREELERQQQEQRELMAAKAALERRRQLQQQQQEQEQEQQKAHQRDNRQSFENAIGDSLRSLFGIPSQDTPVPTRPTTCLHKQHHDMEESKPTTLRAPRPTSSYEIPITFVSQPSQPAPKPIQSKPASPETLSAARKLQAHFRTTRPKLVALHQIERDLSNAVSELSQPALSTPISLEDSTGAFLPHHNKSFVAYEEALTRLLMRADAIGSDGSHCVRDRRKAVVKEANMRLEELDAVRKAAIADWQARQQPQVPELTVEAEKTVGAEKDDGMDVVENSAPAETDDITTATATQSPIDEPNPESSVEEQGQLTHADGADVPMDVPMSINEQSIIDSEASADNINAPEVEMQDAEPDPESTAAPVPESVDSASASSDVPMSINEQSIIDSEASADNINAPEVEMQDAEPDTESTAAPVPESVDSASASSDVPTKLSHGPEPTSSESPEGISPTFDHTSEPTTEPASPTRARSDDFIMVDAPAVSAAQLATPPPEPVESIQAVALPCGTTERSVSSTADRGIGIEA